MEIPFKFYPVASSWVAFHPKPKGIFVFIGGTFYGSFSTLFYQYLLKQLFAEGYTIIVLPFRFTWRHWSVALSLLREQQILRDRIPKILKDSGFEDEECKVYLENKNYIWLGHSLGCKYIALLEFLANWKQNSPEVHDRIRSSLSNSEAQIAEIERQIAGIDVSLKDQYSILLAPEISGTEAAIPIPQLSDLIDRLNLGVQPTPEDTFSLIKNSPLFNLTGLISFRCDGSIAGTKDDKILRNTDGTINRKTNTVPWLREVKPQLQEFYREIEGGHLRPLGLRLGDQVFGQIAAPPNNLVPTVLHLLDCLRKDR
ncbi:DUF1350 family protein [Leptolyngbya ohadii]|uniref:DUF1350 family protein n=1 Tax=Leptolyngbya ohadii TaxID=1962290 RepID=UPI000B59FA55|nr:DUF1350 family protein [Leptolyngbya ohadii]